MHLVCYAILIRKTVNTFFFGCPFARALWSATCWGLQVDSMNFTLAKDTVSFIMESPASLIPTHETWSVSLNMALVIEEIWMSRNLKLFSNIDPDAMKTRQNIQTRFNEIVKSLFFSYPTTKRAKQQDLVSSPFWLHQAECGCCDKELGLCFNSCCKEPLRRSSINFGQKTPQLLPCNCVVTKTRVDPSPLTETQAAETPF